MKKFLGLFVFLVLLNGCDDGDLTVSSFSFSGTDTVQSCPLDATVADPKQLLYKISGNEAIILNIPSSFYRNQKTDDGVPRTRVLQAGELIYRVYASTPAGFCSSATAAPAINEEWSGTATVYITSKPVLTDDTSTPAVGDSIITKYDHQIILQNITFSKGEQQQVISTMDFGSFSTPYNVRFNFSPNNVDPVVITKCPSKELLFVSKTTLAIILLPESSAALFPNTVGTRTQPINATNRVAYRIFNASPGTSYFCANIPPVSPTVKDEWYAQNNIAGNTNGIIQVVTTAFTDPNNNNQIAGYSHTVTLKNVTFENTLTNFPIPQADYILGVYNVNL